jgi:hypothetical protein
MSWSEKKKEVRKVILKRLYDGQNLSQARKGIFSQTGFGYLSNKWLQEGIYVLEVVGRSKKVVFTDKGLQLLKELEVLR